MPRTHTPYYKPVRHGNGTREVNQGISKGQGEGALAPVPQYSAVRAMIAPHPRHIRPTWLHVPKGSSCLMISSCVVVWLTLSEGYEGKKTSSRVMEVIAS